ILLILKTLIGSEKGLEPRRFCNPQAPSLVRDQPLCGTVNALKPGISRRTRFGNDSSMSTSKRSESLSCQFERRDGLFTAHGREIIKKLLERISGLEVVH